MKSYKAFSVLISLLLVVGSIFATTEVQAQTSQPPFNVTLNFFWGNGCPHCAEEEKFLKEIQGDYPTLTIKKFEVWGSAKNRELFKKAGEQLGVSASAVPLTIVGNKYVAGFYTEDTTGAEIRDYIESCLQTACVDIVTEPTPTQTAVNPWENAAKSLPRQVNFPILGSVDLTKLSLPVIAIVIGTLDGFNPCAMWVLLFLVGLLLNLKDRKRMWLLGWTFILTSSLVYFFFMSAWLNILLFLGVIVWVRVAIALVALVAGAVNLRKFQQHTTGCIVEKNEKRQKTFDKLKKAAYNKNLLTALLGIVALAFAVNLVELLCSAGFPAIFTQILALNKLSTVGYYLYIALYILFFMLDDIVVFVIAMKTLETVGISTKYAKYSHLIGGLLMMLIGALLILKPQYLTFSF